MRRGVLEVVGKHLVSVLRVCALWFDRSRYVLAGLWSSLHGFIPVVFVSFMLLLLLVLLVLMLMVYIRFNKSRYSVSYVWHNAVNKYGSHLRISSDIISCCRVYQNLFKLPLFVRL